MRRRRYSALSEFSVHRVTLAWHLAQADALLRGPAGTDAGTLEDAFLKLTGDAA